uniref:Cytosolic carboxypeptidase 2 n=1 Tax=Schistosoma haematobium TaxID=6185 RepID=A0A094ZI10_SCHHA
MIAETLQKDDGFPVKTSDFPESFNPIREEWIGRILKEKSKDVLKTRQIYYSLLNNGKLAAKLSKPKSLDSDHSTNWKPNSIKLLVKFTASKSHESVGQSINLLNDSKFLKFESRFESGNLSKAICTLFAQGMRPLMYSEKMAKLTGIGWRRVGSDINYYQTKYTESTDSKPQFKNKPQKDDTSKLHQTYSLTWKFEFPYPNDIVYFAACYPYTYTQLQEYLNKLTLNSSIKRICQQATLCYTLASNPVPLLTITEPDDYDERISSDNKNVDQLPNKSRSDFQAQPTDNNHNKPLEKKRCVVITARVHPGETQGSWMMKGLLDFLISTDPDAKVLRSNFVFKLIPMLNPDGVIVGNYRCSLSGCDLNRKYTSSLKRFFPTIWHTKQMIINVMKQYEVVVYCDLHGHSRKQQMFIYGCKSQTPEKQYYSRIFPAMLSKNIPELFNFDKCKFAVQKEKEGTGRIVMWREGIINSYTLEATFCGTAGNDLEDGYHFNFLDFEKMGSHFCDTLLDYIDPDHKKKFQLTSQYALSISLKFKSCKQNSTLYPLARSNIFLPSDLKNIFLKLKMEHIMEYLKNRLVSMKVSKSNEFEDDKLSSDDSMSDSSDVGSDSSNCDELPAYYAYVLQKSKKKGKRKRRITQKRDIKSVNKKPFVHRYTTLLREKVCPVCGTYACCRDLNLTEESSKSGKQIQNNLESKKSFQLSTPIGSCYPILEIKLAFIHYSDLTAFKEHNYYRIFSRNQQNGYVSDGIISFKRNYKNSNLTFDNHREPDMVCLKPFNKQSSNQNSTLSQETLREDHVGSQNKNYTRKENVKPIHHGVINQDLDLPKIDIGSNCLIHQLIHLRTHSAPIEHTLMNNNSKKFNSFGFNFHHRKLHYDSVYNYSNIDQDYPTNLHSNNTVIKDKDQKWMLLNHFKFININSNQNEELTKIPSIKQSNNQMLLKNGQFRRVSKSPSIYSTSNSNNNNNTFLNVTRHYSPKQSIIMNTVNKTTLSHHLQRHLNELNTINKRDNPLDHSISLKSNDVSPHHFINNKLKVHNIRKLNYEPKIHDENLLNTIMLDGKPIHIFNKKSTIST